MPTTSQRLVAASIDRAARQWKTLGVALAGKGHVGSAIDPEALISFTAALGDADKRLRDESQDWCNRYGARLISTPRLRNVRALFPPESSAAIDEYLATVNAHAPTRWPVDDASALALDWSASNKSRLPRLPKNEALLRLQLRTLFGVGARAEIILALATGRPRTRFSSASELTFTGYSKRTVAMVLEDLALSELLSVRKIANRIGYRLASESLLSKLVPALRTAHLTRWDLRLALVTGVRLMVDTTEDKPAIVRSVEARRFATHHADAFDALDLVVPDIADPDDYFDEFTQWALDELV